MTEWPGPLIGLHRPGYKWWLGANSGHTSNQANEPLRCPLFNMNVTPAGYSLSHCENYFSIKMQELELCPGRAAKNTALQGTCHQGTRWPLSSPFSFQACPTPAGSLLKHWILSCLSLTLNLTGRQDTRCLSYTDGETGADCWPRVTP